jgi:arginine decarboxylase
VLIDRNCHTSHHDGLILGGAHPIYLDAYPLQDYVLYRGVPLRTIKQTLLALRRAGRLDALKMVLLTSCTFDGITYNPSRVMQEVLAIKPDVVFLWDEAWFAFVNVHPPMRHRAAMASARALEARLRTPGYRGWTGSTPPTTPPGSTSSCCPTPSRPGCAPTPPSRPTSRCPRCARDR